jgi:nicotinate dehydrogenase subunit B
VTEPGLPTILRRYPRLGQWITITPAGEVRVRSGKTEYGQGIRTAIAIMVADELDVPPGAITVEPVDTDDTPDEGVTSGSRSVEEAYAGLRVVAGALRQALIEAAAVRLELEPADVAMRGGVLSTPDGRHLGIAEVAAGLDDRLVKDQVAGRPPRELKLTGRGLPRLDLPAKVRGAPSFVHDLALPGMLHVRVVRPPAPGARLLQMDDTAMADLPGLVTVVRDGSFLAVVTVREHQAVVALRRARRLSQWSDGTYGLPSSHHPLGAPTVDQVVTAVNEAAVREPTPSGGRRIEASYSRPYLAHASLGPSCAVALKSEDRMRVWSHTQGPHYLRDQLAKVLRVPSATVRVTHVEGPGCYGANGADDAALDAALVARALPGRPVRVQWTREDEFAWEPYGTPQVVRMSATLDSDGEVIAWTHEAWSNGHRDRPGAEAPAETSGLLAARDLADPFQPSIAPGPSRPGSGGGRNAAPPYSFPAVNAINHYVPNTPVRVSALRSLGGHTNVFACESFADEIALQRNEDPVTWRLRHLDDPRAREVIERVAADAHWPGVSAEGLGLGIGYARYKGSGALVAIIAEVEAGDDIALTRVWAGVDAGLVIDPDGLRNQAEGGIVQAASWTLREQVRFDNAGVASRSWDTYPILRFREVPAVHISTIPRPDKPPLGVGEAFAGPTAAAIANACFAATGIRVRKMPLTRERFLEATT